MPEGPEIRQTADMLARALQHREIEAFDLQHASLSKSSHAFEGHQVTSVDCRGKALLTQLSSGYTLYSHNQLYGVWKVTPRGKPLKTNRRLRLALHTQEHSAMLFSATDISLWKTDEIEEHPFLKRLGPDVLATNTDAELILTRLLGKSCRNRQLASLYLDQSFVAGLGNYLRSEILFFSGVNPADKPRNLNEAQVHALAKNTIEISQRSYRTSGVTLPKKYRPAIKKKSGRAYEQNRFAVFARAGKPCHFCATPVQKSIATSRRIYWCPQCQPRSE